jgi:putative addiction module component (TIGR02574 family)
LPAVGDWRRIVVMTVPLKDLLELSLEQRLKLVEELWDSIAADLDAEPLPDKLKVELDRRLDAYVKDPSRSLSLEEVRKRMNGPR